VRNYKKKDLCELKGKIKFAGNIPFEADDKAVKRLKDYCNSDPNIIFALIFGSTTTGKNKKNSDLDIAIYFKIPPEGFDILKFINKLSELSGKEVDLVILNYASALLRHQVIKHKINITIKDMMLYREFREKTFDDYFEYKYISGMDIYDR
jgi:hypothetical protein